jgi:hypothetical protein
MVTRSAILPEEEYFEIHPDEENILELEADVQGALEKPGPGQELFWLHKKAKFLAAIFLGT